MKVTERASLRDHNSFGIQASAGLLLTVESEEDLLSMPAFDPGRDFVLGGGSNVLFVSDVPGTVFLNRIAGKEIIDRNDKHALVEVGAGENWHQLVRWSLKQELYGLENLSLIPGLAGAAPMQNIGAYGVELSSVLENVTAWDWRRSTWVGFSKDDCGLAYRSSRFKTSEPDRYLITSIRLRLNRSFSPQTAYPGLSEALLDKGISQPTAKDVSDAVIRIRRRKLPDPAITGNAGSFFKNPVIPLDQARALVERFPALPVWPAEDEMKKLSAAWMIERCGLKGCREGDAGVSDRHALVLINHGSASGLEISTLADRVSSTVYGEFGVKLEVEPRIVKFD
jgi:UDP-N-acetylmuramate dehydrogenase